MSQEPLHPDSPPREGWYWKFGQPRDRSRPLASRPKLPVHVWLYEWRDDVGDLLDDVKHMVTIGSTTRPVEQDEWLHIAKHPITKEEYDELLTNGNWRDFNAPSPE